MPDQPYVADITLDRSSPVPLYFQVSTPIAALIADGTLPAGTRLEDELSMARRLQISRPTARQALQRLVDQGLLTRRRGVGTIVAPRQVHRPLELTSLHSDLVSGGHRVTTTVLEYDEHPASAEEASALETQPGTAVTRVTRLRTSDGEPIALMTNLIPSDITPPRDRLAEEGLYDILRSNQVVPTTAHQVIGARSATTLKCCMVATASAGRSAASRGITRAEKLA